MCVVGVAGVLAAASTASGAVCNNGDSRARDVNGTPTGEDWLFANEETVIYGEGAESNFNPGYLGVTGSNGYIEASGSADDDPDLEVDWSLAGGEAEGRAGVDTGGVDVIDACINGEDIL